MTTPLIIATEGYLAASGGTVIVTLPEIVIELDEQITEIIIHDQLDGESMAITVLNLIRYRGDTDPHTFTVKNKDGAIIDITGHTFELSGNSLQNPPTPTTTEIFSSIGSVPVGTDGKVSFPFTAIAAYNNLGIVYADIQITFPSGIIKTIAKGKIKYIQDITK